MNKLEAYITIKGIESLSCSNNVWYFQLLFCLIYLYRREIQITASPGVKGRDLQEVCSPGKPGPRSGQPPAPPPIPPPKKKKERQIEKKKKKKRGGGVGEGEKKTRKKKSRKRERVEKIVDV